MMQITHQESFSLPPMAMAAAQLPIQTSGSLPKERVPVRSQGQHPRRRSTQTRACDAVHRPQACSRSGAPAAAWPRLMQRFACENGVSAAIAA